MRKQANVKGPAALFYGAVTVGERGQVVIPAEARKQNHLHAGEKLLVFRHPHLHGVMLARLEEVQEVLAELQEWTRLVSRVSRDLAATSTSCASTKRTRVAARSAAKQARGKA
jgi:AbrB family looped-hinge helix DNA binding protein